MPKISSVSQTTAPTRRIARLLLPLMAAALLVLSLNATSSGDHELKPTKEMASQTRWVVNTINSRHYLRDSIDKLNGEEMVEAYIESFDYSRMYFLKPEMEEFYFRFADSMEGFLEKGNLYAAFEIYETFKEVATARTEWALERLEKPWDFTVDETFRTDRREMDWPATKEEADALWERRIKYELLNELLSLASETDNDESVSLEPKNPDIMEPEGEDESFDPSKIQRLLNDEDFYAEKLEEAREKIRRRYARNLKYTVERQAAEVQESFINAMTQLFDPHSTFLSSDTLESFNSSVQNSFVGIGALLQNDDGICVIKELIPGGPAEESRQLEPEDQILGVAQGKDGEFEDVVDLELRYIVRKIKGEKGTTVRLLIRPGQSADPSVRKEVSIVRDEVKLTANLAEATLITVPVEGGRTIPVGVIELPSFYGNIGAGGTLTTTTDDVSELINKLRKLNAQGIILDLRMNGGGLLSEAVRLTGLFIPVGPVVQVRDSNGRTEVLADRDPRMLWEGPLIVLTSRFSASASEIVAGALQDHDRALIVGNSSTHGKGTVQEVYQMNNRMPFSWFKSAEPEARPVASKITIKQFYLPEGSSTQVKGVPSDISLPSVNEFLPIGEDDLPHALPWDKIDKVKWMNDWAKLEVESPEDPELIKKLTEASMERQENLEEFRFLNRQIDWRRERYEQKEISVNLEKRIERKINEQAYIEELDDTYDALKEDNYSMQEVLLELTKEQNAISEKNRADPIVGSNGEADESDNEAEDSEEDDEPSYDIYLRESARIMADWIMEVSPGPVAQRAK
ncbi:tail-specific protease [Coraliomargarita sinensis]|uniref:Tail-specific protease n=1 Tax=Coraliomargarita sinensis TaxID=2174842 RepID=A0A317ZIX6_9BACT|nr:carboxy terminal-processing peptidase [Coraliomargarita sinensis]PXA05490.1 tail-specific protease [Coraliomargarita sinensis]